MNQVAAVGVGFLLGALHLLVFTRGLQALMAGEGSGHTRRRWGLLAGGRFLMTAVLGVLASRFWGLSPAGLGGGLILAFLTWRVAACLLVPAVQTSKENSS